MYFKTEPQDTICRSQMGCIALHLVKLSAPSISSANLYVCNLINDKEESSIFQSPYYSTSQRTCISSYISYTGTLLWTFVSKVCFF